MSNMIQKIMSEKYRQQLRVLDPDSIDYVDLTDEELRELRKLMKRRILLSPVKRRAKRYGYMNLMKKRWFSAQEDSPVRMTKKETAFLKDFPKWKTSRIFYFFIREEV